MSEETFAVARSYWDAANAHSGDQMNAVLSDDYVHHDPGLPVPHADRETHIQIIAGGMFSAFPDLHITIHDMIGEGDSVPFAGPLPPLTTVSCQATLPSPPLASGSK